MAKKQKDITSDFSKLFRTFGHTHMPYRVFSDFCLLASTSLSNSMWKLQPYEIVECREQAYLKCAAQYNQDELSKMAELLETVTLGLEENPDQDFLGSLYMELGLYNTNVGQFFTPYHISSMMAKMSLTNAPDLLKTRKYITICDPCVGGGSKLIAAFNAAKELGINPHTQCLFHGIDIDSTALRMAYIQLSLLGACGHFILGNSLSDDVWDVFSTPLFHLNFWRFNRWKKGEFPAIPSQFDTNPYWNQQSKNQSQARLCPRLLCPSRGTYRTGARRSN